MFESKIKCPRCENKFRNDQFSNIIYHNGICICYFCAITMQDESIRELCNDKYQLENENRRLKQTMQDTFGYMWPHYKPLPKVPSSYYLESDLGHAITIKDDVTRYPNISSHEIVSVYSLMQRPGPDKLRGLNPHCFQIMLTTSIDPLVLWYIHRQDRDATFKSVQAYFLKHLLKDK